VKGSTKKVYDTSYNLMTYPVGYYKALLRVKNGTWDAAGFYYDHKNHGNYTPSWSEAITIDALEAKVGVDFFVNLSSKVGATKAAQIESTKPSAWW
jgi:endonuclease G